VSGDILIADDQKELRDVLSDHLRAEGYVVDEAANGASGTRCSSLFRSSSTIEGCQNSAYTAPAEWLAQLTGPFDRPVLLETADGWMILVQF
jgi:CheY-like chemotaxis protein